MTEPFLGEMRIFAGWYAPQYWAMCDGTALPIAQEQPLFSLLGTTFGGDSRKTFKLPDLRGRAPVHPGDIFPIEPFVGWRGGSETVFLEEGQCPDHTHTLQAVPRGQFTTGNSLDPAGNYLASPQTGNAYEKGSATIVEMANYAVSETGGDKEGEAVPHNNMQPFIAVNFIIALYGYYPNRP